MKKRFSWLTLIVCVIVATVVSLQFAFVLGYKYSREDAGNDQGDISSMEHLAAVKYAYENYYFKDLDRNKIEEGLIQGYIYGTGDKYGEYMNAEQYKSFITENEGENVGIGVSVIYNEEYKLLEVVNVTDNSPADNAGIKIGDMIYTVEGEEASVLGYYGTLSKMRGAEGSKVNFSIYRDGEVKDFTAERKKLETENASGHMHPDGVTGIVRLEKFEGNTFEQFKAVVEELISKGAVRLVFDVRNNPGGDLESVCAVLDYLLPEGPIIRMVDKNGEETSRTSDAKELDIPMAVVTNSNTASAAELFSSALRDYDKATLVGEKTYGKGSMQNIIPFTDGSALRITVKTYKPPFSDGYDGVGIIPDIEVNMADEVKDISIYKLTDEQDTQISKAVESFK